MARIALDVMGGDHAPRAPIAGALLALTELDASHRIQLVGQQQAVTTELDALLRGECAAAAAHRDRWELIDAADVITMTDKPSVAVRGKPNSSMVVGLRLQAEGRSDAFVSAGNTGAQMAASKEMLKLHPGLRRPAIGTVFPTARQPVVVIDSGANVDCSADELVQFARLGAVYAEDFLDRASPSIGLLSVGEEAEKGNKAVKEAHKLLLGAGLNFQGNVEGRDVIAGASERGPIDVVVCDGFVGNVLLKFYESVPTLMSELLLRQGFDRGALRKAFSTLDYAERGGAPLLGVCGVSIISHGKSNERAMKNAIKVAVRAVETHLSAHIGRRLEAAGVAGEPSHPDGKSDATAAGGPDTTPSSSSAAGSRSSPGKRAGPS